MRLSAFRDRTANFETTFAKVWPTPTREGRKEGAKNINDKNILAYQPIYLWEITVNKSFTAVASSWDSSPWPVNGHQAHRPAGTVGPVTRGRDI